MEKHKGEKKPEAKKAPGPQQPKQSTRPEPLKTPGEKKPGEKKK